MTEPPWSVAARIPGVRLGTRVAYGFGAVAFGVKDNGFKYLLLFYYDQVLGLPVLMTGLAIAIAFVVDSIWDPTVGYFSDQLRSRLGRRHPLMYAAALPVAASYFLLWNPPAGLSHLGLFAWLVGISIGVRAMITLYETPSTALVAELTRRLRRAHEAALAPLLLRLVGRPDRRGARLSGAAAGGRRPARSAGLSHLTAWSARRSCSARSSRRRSARTARSRICASRRRARPLGVRGAFREVRESLGAPSFAPLLGGAVFYSMAAGLSAAARASTSPRISGRSRPRRSAC